MLMRDSYLCSMQRILFFFALVLVCLQACQTDDDLSNFDVVYAVRFEATWSDSTHPNAYPSNAHFSPLVALSHTPNFYVFFSGYPASSGLRILAETGQTDSIMDEFSYSINTGQALDARVGPDVESPGQSELSIGVTASRHAVTVLSMIAPSPDWFVAGRAVLFDTQDGRWYDKVTIDAISLDGGSDAGIDFTSPNMPMDSVSAVYPITSGPLIQPGDTLVQNMGKFIFERIQ